LQVTTRRFAPFIPALQRRDESPSIGIILCKEKDRTIVEYALKEANKPIGVATYQMFRELPKELKNELPSPEQIALLLEYIALKMQPHWSWPRK
jgi:hypothetical protein